MNQSFSYSTDSTDYECMQLIKHKGSLKWQLPLKRLNTILHKECVKLRHSSKHLVLTDELQMWSLRWWMRLNRPSIKAAIWTIHRIHVFHIAASPSLGAVGAAVWIFNKAWSLTYLKNTIIISKEIWMCFQLCTAAVSCTRSWGHDGNANHQPGWKIISK